MRGAVRELLIGDVPAVGARRAPDAVAASLDGELLTYGQLENRTAAVTSALRAWAVPRRVSSSSLPTPAR